MIPNRIPGATHKFGAPAGMEDQCSTLWVRALDGCLMSLWEPTPDELAALMDGGTVRLTIVGATHPPVALDVMPRESRE